MCLSPEMYGHSGKSRHPKQHTCRLTVVRRDFCILRLCSNGTQSPRWCFGRTLLCVQLLLWNILAGPFRCPLSNLDLGCICGEILPYSPRFCIYSTPCSLNTGGMERFGCNLSQRRRGKGCGGARWFRSHHPSSRRLVRWKLHCPFGVAWLWSCKVLLRPEIFQFFFVYLSPPLQDNIFQWLFNACVGRACPGWSVVGCVGTLDNGICLERNTRSALRSQTHHKRVQTAHPLTFD